MKRILLVDDNPDALYLLRTLLTSNGFEIEESRNGSEAIVKALSTHIDIIISDILMPVIDGFTLCRIVKSDERLSNIPFVIYTATYTDPRDEKLALDMGADAFILKTSEPDEFLSCIRTVLESFNENTSGRRKTHTPYEETVMKQYNEALVRKLEKKMIDLAQAKTALEAEIDARKRVEESLRDALKDREALLKEIHHRVKNNMQVIISMINLEIIERVSSMDKDKIISSIRELQDRIYSMALVHEMLYDAKNLAKVNFSDYLPRLVHTLFISHGIDKNAIAVHVESSEEPMHISTAIPVGQIVNELVTNTIKYAFADGRKGEIWIRFTSDPERNFELTVRDNGIGLPSDFIMEAPSHFGMRLVSLLCRQVNGTIEYRNEGGALFTIRFKDKLNKPETADYHNKKYLK